MKKLIREMSYNVYFMWKLMNKNKSQSSFEYDFDVNILECIW